MLVASEIIRLTTLITTVSFSKHSTPGPGYCPLTRIAALRLASGIENGVWRSAGRLPPTVGRIKSTTLYADGVAGQC